MKKTKTTHINYYKNMCSSLLKSYEKFKFEFKDECFQKELEIYSTFLDFDYKDKNYYNFYKSIVCNSKFKHEYRLIETFKKYFILRNSLNKICKKYNSIKFKLPFHLINNIFIYETSHFKF